MSRKLIDEFYWSDLEGQEGGKLTDADKYSTAYMFSAEL